LGYLKCEKCGGYYELQEGESSEDFSDKCECGGSLKYALNLDETSKADKSTSRFEEFISTDFRAVILGLIIVFIIFIIFKFGHILNFYLTTAIAILIGGLITGYFSKKRYKKGVINGASVGVIFFVIFSFSVFWFLYFTNSNYLDTEITHHLIGDHLTLTEVILAPFVTSVMFGIYGGVIGAIGGIIGNRFSKKK
jgi:hypothetical protein